MKIFTAQQLKALDAATMRAQNVSSFDLVERAGTKVAEKLLYDFPDQNNYKVFVGTGKNGADGLVIARKLLETGKNCEIFVINYSQNHSPELLQKLEQINQLNPKLQFVNSVSSISPIPNDTFIIDALIGAGLNRALTGLLLETVDFLNGTEVEKKIAIDMPTGLSADSYNYGSSIFRADLTYIFELYKLSTVLASNHIYTGETDLIKIDLDKEFIDSTGSDFELVDKELVRHYLPKARKKFSNKGDFGHVLVVAGSQGKSGAAILASKAALKAGAGVVTSYTPKFCSNIIQTALPEAMNISDSGEMFLERFELDTIGFDVFCVGPGLGVNEFTAKIFPEILRKSQSPMIIDADALNIISQNLSLMELVPKNSIFTPHTEEFDRLTGESTNSLTRLEKQINFAKRYEMIVILKGAHTSIALPSGKVFFNSTGNPAMSAAGMGDVLSGTLAGLLAQKLPPDQASVYGVYLHGLAGDLSTEQIPGVLASEVADMIVRARGILG